MTEKKNMEDVKITLEFKDGPTMEKSVSMKSSKALFADLKMFHSNLAVEELVKIYSEQVGLHASMMTAKSLANEFDLDDSVLDGVFKKLALALTK